MKKKKLERTILKRDLAMKAIAQYFMDLKRSVVRL